MEKEEVKMNTLVIVGIKMKNKLITNVLAVKIVSAIMNK